jgi:hypothetical protein
MSFLKKGKGKKTMQDQKTQQIIHNYSFDESNDPDRVNQLPQMLSKKPLSDWRGSITTFDGFTGTRPVLEYENIRWAEICNVLCSDKPAIIEDKKQGQYFIPCLLKEAPLVGNTLETAIRNGQPTIGKMRSKNHVTEASMLVIDVDGLCETDFNVGKNKMANDGLTFLAYTTHSQGSSDKPGMRVRIVTPVDRALTPEEYILAWHGFVQRYWQGESNEC